MKNFKLVISFLVVLLAFSCNADLFTEPEENSKVVAYDGDFQRVAGEDLDDTWWEIVKDERSDIVFNYPVKTILHQKETDKLDHDSCIIMEDDLDPDNDGSNEWINTHIYFHFKDNKAVYYEKEVVNDEGDIQGDYNEDICKIMQRELYTDLEEIHNDFEVKIIDGVIHIVGSEGTDAIYYNVNEMYMMYEDDGIGKTTLKKVNYNDIK